MIYDSTKVSSKLKKTVIPVFASILVAGTFGLNANTADAISPPSAPDGYTYNPSGSETTQSTRSPDEQGGDALAIILGVTPGATITAGVLRAAGIGSSILTASGASNDGTTYTFARYAYLADNPSTSYGGFYLVGVENNDTGEVEFSERKRIGTAARVITSE